MLERLKKWLMPSVGGEGSQYRASSIDSDDATLIGEAYRRHRPEDVPKFTEWAKDAFPDLASRITCFGADWLGRQFATDEARIVDAEPQVLMLDVGAGEALEIPASLTTFHEKELIEATDAAIAVSFYKDWLSVGGDAPTYNQCVGYKRPLFLGGLDEVTNLEIADFEVYWSICGQLLNQTRHLPPGTRIGRIIIGD